MKLDQLKKVLEPISKIGKTEETFDILDMKITLRALEPREELEVQRYARTAFGDGTDPDQMATLEFADRFKLGSLAYSVIQIDDLDLHGVEHLETGEVLKNGVAVKINKVDALMDLMRPWQRPVKTTLFQKFAELMSRSEDEAEAAVKYEPTDLDAEITRLEERLARVKTQKAELAGTKSALVLAREFVLADGKVPLNGVPAGTPEDEPEPVEPGVERVLAEDQEQDPPKPVQRKAIIPEEALPPEFPPQEEISRQPIQVQPLPPLRREVIPGSPEDLMDTGSMVDPNDPEALARAMAEESARIARMRENVLRAAPVQSPVVPPHLAARQAPFNPVDPTAKPQAPKAPQAPSTLNPNFRSPNRNPGDPTPR